MLKNQTLFLTTLALSLSMALSTPCLAFSRKKPKPVTSGSGALSACKVITQGGNYSLASDLAATGNQPCLEFKNASNVTLDCKGHSVSGYFPLSMTAINGFTVKNCTFKSTWWEVVRIKDSSGGTFSGNTLRSLNVNASTSMNVSGSHDLKVSSNQFTASYQQDSSYNNVISDNTIESPVVGRGAVMAFGVGSSDGHDNQILRNRIDGLADLALGETGGGTDDGIVLADERDSIISQNTITNVWDCGFENTGSITRIQIVDNKIDGASICGLGGWYWSNLKGNTISRNAVNNVPTLFMFYRNYSLRAGDTGIYFQDNTFEGNKLTNPMVNKNSYSSMMPVFSKMAYDNKVLDNETAPTASQFFMDGNVFKDNDFGTAQSAPFFGSGINSGQIIDGGGNVCATNGATGYPLTCVTSTSSSLRPKFLGPLGGWIGSAL